MVAAYRTRAQLVRAAADKLNIVGTGQVLEAEYATKIDSNIDPILMQLAVDDICEILDDNFIPAELFDALAGLLANVSAPIAGKDYDPDAKKYYELQLRRSSASGPTYNVQEAEYF